MKSLLVLVISVELMMQKAVACVWRPSQGNNPARAIWHCFCCISTLADVNRFESFQTAPVVRVLEVVISPYLDV